MIYWAVQYQARKSLRRAAVFLPHVHHLTVGRMIRTVLVVMHDKDSTRFVDAANRFLCTTHWIGFPSPSVLGHTDTFLAFTEWTACVSMWFHTDTFLAFTVWTACVSMWFHVMHRYWTYQALTVSIDFRHWQWGVSCSPNTSSYNRFLLLSSSYKRFLLLSTFRS
jgi:hypothetical protein